MQIFNEYQLYARHCGRYQAYGIVKEEQSSALRVFRVQWGKWALLLKKKCYRVRSTVIREMEKVRVNDAFLKEHYLMDQLRALQAEEVMQGMQRSRNQNGEEGMGE